MQDQDWTLPLQMQAKAAISCYLPRSEEGQDLPCQLQGNPFSQRVPTNHSISKWACTQLSTQQHRESTGDELSPLPLVDNILSEATFKPKELKQQLRENNQLKKILQHTLQKRQKKAACQRNEAKSTTRYEKILQEFFKGREKRVKSRANLSLRDKHAQKEKAAPHLPQPKTKAQKTQHAPTASSARNYPFTGRTHSHRQLPSSRPLQLPRSQLTKTFNHQSFPHLLKAEQVQGQHLERGRREGSQGWMAMNFEERQVRVLSSRREKQSRGRKENLDRQQKECTFKPCLKAYKPGPTAQAASSYTKLYLEKVRARLG